MRFLRRTGSEKTKPRTRQRGAVMVEVTIVVPLLLTLLLGTAELGLKTTEIQNVVSATRAGARVGSSAGDTRLADFVILQSLAGALDGFQASDIERIIVFKPGADGSLPATCAASSQAGLCNHYDATDLAAPESDFLDTVAGGTQCAPASVDHFWCPLDRNVEWFPGTDWIGVRVEVRHHSIAPFLSDSTMIDTTIMRLEPEFSS